MSDILNKNKALKKLLDAHLDNLCAREGLERSVILNAISDGTMVLLGNPCHKNVEPILVGQPAGIKVNANIGTSPLCNSPEMDEETERSREGWRGHGNGSFHSR